MKESEENNHMTDLLEVVQGQHKEIKNIAKILKSLDEKENAIHDKIEQVDKQLSGINAGEAMHKEIAIPMEFVSNATTKIDLLVDIVRHEIRQRPRSGKFDISIHIRGRNLIIVVIGCLLLGAIGIGFWATSWKENRRTRENDLKYRYLMMKDPIRLQEIDSIYKTNPDSFSYRLGELEYKQYLSRELQKLEAEGK